MRRSAFAKIPRGDVKSKSFALKGGLNLVDAPLTIPPGMASNVVNFELLTRDGYRRISGYERFDGKLSPNDASYWILNYDGGTAAINEGDVITGLTSGHTGIALINQVGTVAAGFLVLTAVTGIFTDNETLQVAAANKAVANGNATERGAATPAEDTTYIQDAIETQRLNIFAVGVADGSGPVLGVAYHGIYTYAFRNNATNTGCNIYVSTTIGWVKQNLGLRINFNAGTSEFFYNETLSQAGQAAIIKLVVVTSGDWATNDAVGYIITGVNGGTGFVAGAITSSGSGAATSTGAQVDNTLLPGGRYEFEEYNFYGSSRTQSLFAVNGVGPAFSMVDGLYYVPIPTGNTVDTPEHIAVNESHLQLSFPNGSLQNSATGDPYLWAGGGAAEIGLGNPIIGMKKEVGGALIIVCRNRTFALHGKNTTALPWDLKTLSDEAGGIEWSLQRLGTTKYMDDRGFMDVKAVLDFGDFNTSTYSQVIEPLINVKKKLVVSSIIVKAKSQIRTFFSDGTGIITTFSNNKLSGFTNFKYLNSAGSSIVARCTANGETAAGDEVLFFGSDDGYVYQIDKGPSFDGGEVSATLTLTYNNLGSPEYNKQFKKVIIEADGSAGVIVKYNALFDYSSGRSPTGITLSKTLAAGGSLWNTVNWNAFSWASEDVTRIEGNISGVGRNIALQIFSASTYEEPYTLYGITYNYIMRKLVR